MSEYLVKDLFGLGIGIRWYGFIICIGMCLGITVAVLLAKKRGYNLDMVIDLALFAVPLAILGARLYYVAFDWSTYQNNLLDIFAIWKGGLAIYGAVIGGLIGCLLFCKFKKVPLGDVMDVAAPGLILGQAIGRWGNFINQEAYGNLIANPAWQWFPYGVYIKDVGEWHQATFFYESVWNLVVFAVLLWYFKRARHKGNVAAMYFTLYGLGRAFIEGLRMDSLWLIQDVIRVSQALSILLVIAGTIYIGIKHSKPAREFEYTGSYQYLGKKQKEEKKQ